MAEPGGRWGLGELRATRVRVNWWFTAWDQNRAKLAQGVPLVLIAEHIHAARPKPFVIPVAPTLDQKP